MSDKTSLTFDVDDVDDVEEFTAFVSSIIAQHGDNVWVRKSSSGEGYHLKVVDGTFFNHDTGQVEFKERLLAPQKVIEIRENTDGECRGRLKGDKARLGAGMNVGRLFFVKTGQVCGEWIPANLFLENPSLI
tara:strand:+ start:78 stop:473 length:396 start_codon:yes stop_codon:yes gene_type:complete